MVPTKELKKLKAFHNDPKLKKDMVLEILNHQKQDQIIKGTYEREDAGKFKGCAVGCSIHSYNIKRGKTCSPRDHHVYETELGIPESLARLEDYLFEAMPNDKSQIWPAEFMKAVSVGSNLSMVAPKFIAGTLRDLLTLKEVKSDKEVTKAVAHTAKLWEMVIAGKNVKAAAWSAAESAAWSAAESAAWSAAAWSAAESAAWSAAESAAESAAWSAAWSAARSAARSAAWSAARSAAWSAARSAAWSAAAYKMSRRLLKIIKSCK